MAQAFSGDCSGAPSSCSALRPRADRRGSQGAVGRAGRSVPSIGAGTFAVGDRIITRYGGSKRKDSTGKQSSGSSLAIVLGSVLDGIPESFILGLTVLQGGVSIPLLAGIALSNQPEALSSSSGLRIAG